MTNKELQRLLATYPDNMPVRLEVNGPAAFPRQEIDFTGENIILTSDTAYADDEAPEEEWDCEDGKVVLGDGEQYLLLNPLIS